MDNEKLIAVNDAASSNKLEKHDVTPEEFKRILADIDKTDESFLSAVIEYVEKNKGNKKEEEKNVQIRK